MSSPARFWDHEPAKFVVAYVVSGLLAVLAPAIKHGVSVHRYKSSYYYYNNEENEEGSGDRRWTDLNNCRWWKWWCTSQWVNENGEYRDNGNDNNNNNNGNGNGNDYYSTPSWFSGWGNGNMSGDSRDSNANSGAIKFVYSWQLLMFLGLLAYGAMVLFKFRGPLAQSRMALWSLFILLFAWANFSFLMMWLVANGSIYTEGREMEAVGGFYNQFSVLLFISNFWYMVWSLCFCIALGLRIFRKAGQEGTEESKKPGDSMNYLPYSEPGVTSLVTGVSTGVLPQANNNRTSSGWW